MRVGTVGTVDPATALVIEGRSLTNWNITRFRQQPCTYARGMMCTPLLINTATMNVSIEIAMEDYVSASPRCRTWGDTGGLAALEAQVAVAARSHAHHACWVVDPESSNSGAHARYTTHRSTRTTSAGAMEPRGGSTLCATPEPGHVPPVG